MANQSVLELAVNVGRWDAGLKKAKQSLDNFTQASGGIQQALEKDSQKMQQFVRMMGNMESTAKTAKGQMNDYKGTIEQLTMQYNRMTDAQKKSVGQDYLNTIDQIKQKYQAVNEEIQEMNRSLNQVKPGSIGGGGDLGGSMTMASFKGNVYAYAAEKGAEALNMLKDKITDVLKESMKMSMEAEGIRIAYERLGRPDLMDKLKEATHGTVTELELMKQAVKFNDFRLSLDDMGAMLAFAQQKAKDTGQSIDFMVDSIVTGLGRQSKQILDNLGISAAEIGEKMKTSGDMTKAVAEIIREQMSKSGDYIETSMDRAAKAAVAVRDEMLTLGDQMRETFGTGSIEELSSMLELRLIKDLESLVDTVGDLSTGFGILGTDAGKSLKAIADVAYVVVREFLMWQTGLFEIVRLISGISGDSDKKVGSIAKNIQSIATGYANAYGNANVLPEFVVTGQKGGNKKGGGSSNTPKQEQTEMQQNQQTINTLTQEYVRLGKQATEEAEKRREVIRDEIRQLEKQNGLLRLYAENAQGRLMGGSVQTTGLASSDFKGFASAAEVKITGLSDDAKKKLAEANKDSGNQKTMAEGLSQLTGSVGSIVSGLDALGIEVPEELTAVVNTLSGISSILSGISGVVSAIETIVIAKALLAGGGIVPHAAGGYAVPGNHYSGDLTPIMANAGELVLNKAQQGNLASQLEGDRGKLRMNATLKGQDILLSLDRTLQSTGKELAVWG